MKIRFIGDVHGKFKTYRKRIRNIPYSVQIGDMGVGFKKRVGDDLVNLANPPFDSMSKGTHYFIRGNHDNPAYCRNHPCWIADGTYMDGVFYVGGGLSVDKYRRIEGLNWWPDEECSTEELYSIADRYRRIRPNVVVSHDCPATVAESIMEVNRAKHRLPSVTRFALESMFDFHQPKLWIFGHWHKNMRFSYRGTDFICLDELSYVDIDMEAF